MNAPKQTVASLAAAALLVALVVAVSLFAFRQIQTAAEARSHAYGLVVRGHALLSALTDAETGEHGYVLTGDEAFLQSYTAVRASIGRQLAELRPLTFIGAAREHLDALAPLVEAKLAQMAQVVELRRNRDLPAAMGAVGSGQGKTLMDSIRAEMNGYIQVEDEALTRHEAEFQSNMSRLFAAIIVASLLTLLFALSFAYLAYREAQHRLKNLLHLETKRLLDAQEETNRQLRQVNATLEVSEEKLAVTLNSIGDAVIATDADGRVTLLNPLAEQLTGWKRAEAAGCLVDDIFHIVNQETRLPSTIPVKETLARGTMHGLANHTLLIARDGSERAIADSCAPIRDRDGRVVGAVLIFRDVTREYAAQQALNDSAALIKAILNTVADGVITIHARGGLIERSNAAAERMFGYSAAELVGQDFSLLIPELDRDQRNGSLEYYSASNAERAAGLGREVVGRRKDGGTFPLEMAVSEMSLGGQRYFTGVLRDITARKRVEEALQQKNTELESARSVADKANLAKSEFLSSMSHELRTPLNAILGFAQVIESGSPPPTPAQKRSLDQILKAGWYLLELINEILDLARIESGKLTLSREPVSLDHVLVECQAMIEPQAQLRGISMQFPRIDTPRFVLADRTRLKQVLINLLFNAVKYNKSGGTVIVDCVLVAPNSVRISVSDSGEGLPPEKLEQLFQPFNRLGKEAGVEEGTGIGLVVAKRLVELMGGIIGVDSTVGAGTVFWVELDLCAPPQHAAEADEFAAPGGAAAASGAAVHTLLYVEDNPANLKLVEELVKRRPDLRLLTAADGPLGIALAREFLPEVILMDINLPGISGTEAMTILRADPATAHIPIVAISANAIPGDIRKGLDAGFLRYLTKPIVINEFMHALDVALQFSAARAGNAVIKDVIQ